MDKKLILAVAGSGKTSHIVSGLSLDKRTIIITYTNANYDNLLQKISKKFNGALPKNITVYKYYPFLYSFCYKPFLADAIKARGILFDQKIVHELQGKMQRRVNSKNILYYMTENGYFYNNRLSFFLESRILDRIKERIEAFFDEFVIDEVQDIAGRDFNFLKCLMSTNVRILLVGDFFQHTFDTSRDGRVNESLYKDKTAYELHFTQNGVSVDNITLLNSWRCSKNVCEYIQNNLGINIASNRPDMENTSIEHITDQKLIDSISVDRDIFKFHFESSAKFGIGHKNWGDSKGEDFYNNICVYLNKTTAKMRSTGNMEQLNPQTKNKLYVAITRARGNVYLIDESSAIT